MTSIVDRSPDLAISVAEFVFAMFGLPAAWIAGARHDLWWLSLALVVLGAVGAVIAWRKLRKSPWPLERVE